MKLPGITSVEIESAIKLLKDEIDRVGAARTGWALELIRGYAMDASPESELEKVSSVISKSGYYLRTRTEKGKDYYIAFNPSHELNENIRATNRNLLNSTWTITAFTALTFPLTCITTYKFCMDQQLNAQVQPDYSKVLDTLMQTKRQIDSTLVILTKDSLVPKTVLQP